MTDALDDEPLTLEDACQLLFKGAISPASLRAEARRGRLEIERIGRRDFVTRAAIKEMRIKCRLVPAQKAQGSGSSPNASALDVSPLHPPGPSATMADLSNASRAVQMTAEALKKSSKTTSRGSARSLPANVIPLNG